ALDQSAIVAITDQTGRIIHVNDKFCQISRYSREELLGSNHRILNSGFHDAEFFRSMWKCIAGGKVWEGEIKNRAKDGSFYWVNTTIVPFLNEEKKPYQYVAIRYEITQRKAAEEATRVYAARLEASNRELQDFASVAAHDLQEPLRKILGFGDRLQSAASGALNDQSRDYLDRMLSSAKRMRRLIEDLLTFSRVNAKARSFQATPLNAVLAEVLSDLELRIEQSGAAVDVGELPTVEADASQMHQLFQNLLGNSLKFHREGVAPRVEVRGRVRGDLAEITVRDNGIGFDEKYLDRIFTIFQRLHGRHEYEGTGVGLAVCRRIVERHGGSLVAASRPGEGAAFTVILPRRAGAELT
ncbi:MAG: PAS domain-containing sensor histidine kinase, partial [Proteobacteria bacterium]